MTKSFLLILALLAPVSLCAAPAPAGAAVKGGILDSLNQAPGGAVQYASAAAEAGLVKALGVAPADIEYDVELIEELDDSFELKLPGAELPDSDIPLTFNSKVEYFIRYFQTSGRGAFSKWLSRSERYIPMMRTVLRNQGLPEDLVYLAMIESGFTPQARSVMSAVGPWQFMSGTGKLFHLRIDPWIDERRDPLKSTVAAAMYLKDLYALFNNDWYLAAAGYNAGENKILRAINMYNSRDFWELSKGEYLARETKDYVPKLLAAAIIAKEPAKYGFANVAYLPPIEFDTVRIPSRTDLEVIAKATGVSVRTLKELNPELRRSCTPPNYPNYELKIPRGMAAPFYTAYAKIPESERFTEQVRHARYRVKGKETLASVARRFNTTPQALAELNNIGKKARLKGRVLTVPVLLAAADHEDEVGKPSKSVAKAKSRPEESTRYYTVKKGDTLYALAKRFNVTARMLAAWNNMKSKVALKPGRRLIVSKGSADRQG